MVALLVMTKEKIDLGHPRPAKMLQHQIDYRVFPLLQTDYLLLRLQVIVPHPMDVLLPVSFLIIIISVYQRQLASVLKRSACLLFLQPVSPPYLLTSKRE